ncbi:MAG: hypothetical protein Q9157_000846 [Trypethelium eluteriae]
MPHKHKRPRIDDDANFDLPPENRATSLPVGRKLQQERLELSGRKRKRGKPTETGYGDDDTPKAFARLMQMQNGRKKREALDDGHTKNVNKRKFEKSVSSNARSLPTSDAPRILPHERLSDFSARVDQAMPMPRLERRGRGSAEPGARQTRKEKRMQNMYADWRRQDAARRRREEEAREIVEEEEEELDARMEVASGYKFVRGKKRKHNQPGKHGNEEDDPWAKLKETRDQPRGLHDVAQAPPKLKAVPREKFKVKNGAQVQISDVPNTAGSLRRREELGKARNSIIEQYRKLVSDRPSK